MQVITAETIDYVECHGTGTYLGDPIEVAALTEAFHQTTDAVGFCKIGSVKTNIGHLDTAAGIASLGKAALALKHAEIPPTLGLRPRTRPSISKPRPSGWPTALSPWPERDHPRRGGREFPWRRWHQRPCGAGRGPRNRPPPKTATGLSSF